jgi:hypothetical protein
MVKKSKFILGVDLGKNGGFCFMEADGGIVHKTHMPIHVDGEIDHYEIERMFTNYSTYIKDKKEVKVIIEKVHAIFGNSAKSMNTFGERNGYVKALLHIYFGREIEEVTPRKWQKWLNEFTQTQEEKLPNGKKDTKGNAIKAVTSLYPREDFRKNTRCKRPHDGIVDAVGIARYGAENE